MKRITRQTVMRALILALHPPVLVCRAEISDRDAFELQHARPRDVIAMDCTPVPPELLQRFEPMPGAAAALAMLAQQGRKRHQKKLTPRRVIQSRLSSFNPSA